MSTAKQTKKDPAIKYADEYMDAELQPPAQDAPQAAPPVPQAPVAMPPPVMTPERNRANQEAAKRSAEKMNLIPMSAYTFPKPELPEMSAAEAAKLAPRVYVVLEDRRIVKGAASYLLRAGKHLSQNEYDIEGLRRQGVQLEEVTARR